MIGEVVAKAIGIGEDHAKSVFSTRKIIRWCEKHLFNDLKSKKWSPQRLQNNIVTLCQRIDPTFRLSADVKLEAMPEGKAPRMLIADGDEGQVLALMTICCIEDLVKAHFPKKHIKGQAKADAMKMVCEELRISTEVFNKAKKSADDGRLGSDGKMIGPSALTPIVFIREAGNSPVEFMVTVEFRVRFDAANVHVASILKAVMAEPASWVDAHAYISTVEKLSITFKKNGEFAKIVLDAIRRSGHRGTSVLNWWCNFVIWHVVIFKDPAGFLDPKKTWGVDHCGVKRWLKSCYEGDDSVLSTSPPINPGDPLYVSLLQRWERFGYNMEIFVRDKK